MAHMNTLSPRARLKTCFTASCPFFTSHHSYGYALSQENGHLTHASDFQKPNGGEQ